MAMPATPQLIQPEVQKFLEAVFAVAPHPEEYVRYRLHLATALSPKLLDAWFETRRLAAKEQEQSAIMSLKSANGQASNTVSNKVAISQAGQSQAFSLFDGASRSPLSFEQRSLALLASTNREVQDVSRLLTMMQTGSWENGPSSEVSTLPLLQHTDHTASEQSGEMQQQANVSSRLQQENCFDVSNLAVRSDGKNADAVPSNRFTEADLDVISKLVGLETISSKETHCGSRSLYMFEQLTALDSLDPESSSGMKRKRTRHQHFWRNTDKLDPRDRVYVPTASLRPALHNDQPVVPKKEISPDERTNSWTVCLTTSGVVGYLNKRISPLGVQMIRALAGNCKGQASLAGISNPQSLLREDHAHRENHQSGFRRVKPKAMYPQDGLGKHGRTTSPSTSDGVSLSDGGRTLDEDDSRPTFEPAPRARRRKP